MVHAYLMEHLTCMYSRAPLIWPGRLESYSFCRTKLLQCIYISLIWKLAVRTMDRVKMQSPLMPMYNCCINMDSNNKSKLHQPGLSISLFRVQDTSESESAEWWPFFLWSYVHLLIPRPHARIPGRPHFDGDEVQKCPCAVRCQHTLKNPGRSKLIQILPLRCLS